MTAPRSRSLLVGLLGLATLGSCNRAPAQPAASAQPTLTSEDDCTLETPLKPGVPGSPGHLLPSPVNPNGQSELAGVMRTMQADLKAARAAVVSGAWPAPAQAPMTPRHRKLRCAWPTAAADRNPVFDANAQGYLRALGRLETASKDAAPAAFDQVLDACRSCHERTCSGVLVAIEALRIKPRDPAAAPEKTSCDD